MRASLPFLLALCGGVALGGCAQVKSAGQVAKDGGLYNKFVPAAKTTIVGTANWVDLKSAIAVVQLNRAPFPEGKFLVARQDADTPTAVLETTRRASASGFQGVMVVSGTLTEKEEIVEPGPELARMVQENIDSYLVAHPAPAADQPAETATPAAPADTSAPSTELPAPEITPPPAATTP
jgi:hypothetical protein